MEDKAQTNQVQTASMNRTKAPQKVEVVVANSSSGSEVNILGELSIFVLRIGFCALMIHHGLEKLQDPQGFAEFVVGKYFPFLPGDPVIWTFGAAITQLVCPVGLANPTGHTSCCLLYTSPSPRDKRQSRMPSSA